MGLLDWLTGGERLRRALDPEARALQLELQRDPFRRLESAREVAIAAELGVEIDANRASTDDWLRLPGLSIRQASVLAELVQSGVQFHALEDVAAALGLPVARLEPLAPVLRFYYYDPESTVTLPPVNANRADLEELLRLPGVDRPLAERLLRDRAERPFRSLPDLQRRLNLSAAQTEQLLHYLRF